MKGNQLIPINETQVELRNEILTIRWVGRNMLIDVDYTFYNPGKTKEVLMGFEAVSYTHLTLPTTPYV